MEIGFGINYTKQGDRANLEEILKTLIDFMTAWKAKIPDSNNVKIDKPEYFVPALMAHYIKVDELLKAYKDLQVKLNQGQRDYVFDELNAVAYTEAKGFYCNPILIAQGVMRVALYLKEMAKIEGTDYGNAGKNTELSELLSHLESKEFFKQKFAEASSLDKPDIKPNEKAKPVKKSISLDLWKYCHIWSREFNAKMGGEKGCTTGLGGITKDLETLQRRRPATERSSSSQPQYSPKQYEIIGKISSPQEGFKKIKVNCSNYFKDEKIPKIWGEAIRGSGILSREIKPIAELLNKGFNNYEHIARKIIEAIKNSTFEDLKNTDEIKTEKDFDKLRKQLVKDCDKALKKMKEYFKKWESLKKEATKGGFRKRLADIFK